MSRKRQDMGCQSDSDTGDSGRKGGSWTVRAYDSLRSTYPATCMLCYIQGVNSPEWPRGASTNCWKSVAGHEKLGAAPSVGGLLLNRHFIIPELTQQMTPGPFLLYDV
jgi:hypothetical protein